MKNFALCLIAVLTMGSAAMAGVSDLPVQTTYAYSASGGTIGTCNIAAQAGSSIEILSIVASSDTTGGVLTLKKGATTGVTTNYTTLGAITTGTTAPPLYHGYGNALVVLPKNTLFQATLTCTNAHSMLVTYRRRPI